MAAINYQARDFEAVKQSLIEFARQNFPNWTDLNESEQGIILVELYAYIADSLNYYIDKQTDEWDISLVTQRKNMIAMMKLIAYQMAGATAAEATVTFTIEGDARAVNVPIPKGFKVYTKDVRNPIVYEVNQDTILAAGQTSVPVNMTHGETEIQYKTLNGSADQTIRLEVNPFLWGSEIVSIAGETWERVDNLVDSTSANLHYYVEVDENDFATLQFGDGISGIAPTGTAEITYRVGGSSAGEVGPNTLTVPESPQLLDTNGVPVNISCSNAASSTKPTDKETIDHARVHGPNSIAASMRTVSLPDFVSHSMEVDGVARARAMFRGTPPQWLGDIDIKQGQIYRPATGNGHYYVCTVAGVTGAAEPAWPTDADATVNDGTVTWKEYGPQIVQNVARIQIVPTGGGLPTPALKNAVSGYLYDDKPVQTTLTVDPVDPKYKAIDAELTIITYPGIDQAAARAATQTAVENYLKDYAAKFKDQYGRDTDEYVLDWGMTLYPDDLAIKVEGVRSVRVNIPAGAVIFNEDEIPAPGAVVVN